MKRRSVLMFCGALAVSACTSSAPQLGRDGRPLPQVYKISPAVAAKIPFHLLDSVNTLRSAKGAAPLQFNAQLNAAAATHSRDMSVQNRPWHFGSDGSSPLVRVQRVGYTGTLLGELISETYETELETLAVWSGQPDTRAIIMDPAAREIGFAWYQEPNGKIWWTMVTGTPGGFLSRATTPYGAANPASPIVGALIPNG
ncbi:CAP domain-containing protein [Rhodobacter ferrooxidans]|uniref:SCP-like extracellular n=1 Tax=Rhodobacter ferrooxidans TaxID=371731 RepID=C8S248_9RHOB|nr:CAP domain-containing protein [Rhodobacter sp. SW2]EEW24920.1 SCP-like extracellular [Rhodobacter sp. SW2]